MMSPAPPLNRFPEFDNHELVVPVEDKATGLQRLHRHPFRGSVSLGATRRW